VLLDRQIAELGNFQELVHKPAAKGSGTTAKITGMVLVAP
jgi:hypothetical protein